MPSNVQISIKEKKQKLRTATKTTKLTLTSDPNCQSHFVKYATTLTLYNRFPKPIQEAEKYCAIVPKLKRYLFHKTLARSLSNRKKITLSVVCGKRNVQLPSCPTLLLTLSTAFAFRHDHQEKNFFFLCKCCDVFSIFKVPKLEFRLYLHRNQYPAKVLSLLNQP